MNPNYLINQRTQSSHIIPNNEKIPSVTGAERVLDVTFVDTQASPGSVC